MFAVRTQGSRLDGLKAAAASVVAALFVCACQQPATSTNETGAAADQPRQIKVITSGGFTNAFDILAPIFGQATGIEVVTAYGSSMGGGPDSIPMRLDRGEPADLLIFNDSALELLDEAGHIRADTRVVLARALIAMAVRSGAPKPDISTTEAFVDTLLAAESIGYSASVSGTYLSSEVFPRLGIWEDIEAKTRRIVTERVASVVARGEVEIGFQPVSELMGVVGAEIVGPIPDELQQVSTFVAVITANAGNPEDAARLAEFLSSEAVAAIVESTGLSVPPARDATAASDQSSSQVEVITSGGFTAAFGILAPMFEQAAGIEVLAAYGSSMGGGPESIPVRLANGETYDILIMNRPPLDELAEAGSIRPETRIDLGRSLVGMAVRSGAPKPDISTREALIDTLLAAESIGYSASVSGTYLSSVVFPELGVWEAIEPKTKRIFTERVASVVARGEVEIGFQQISAILPVEGADFAGTIPDELQEVAFFSAGIMQDAENPRDAQRLLEFLASAAVAGVIESTGLGPVVAGGGGE
jgi:molybdate transport system substrate-binding protein